MTHVPVPECLRVPATPSLTKLIKICLVAPVHRVHLFLYFFHCTFIRFFACFFILSSTHFFLVLTWVCVGGIHTVCSSVGLECCCRPRCTCCVDTVLLHPLYSHLALCSFIYFLSLIFLSLLYFYNCQN